MTDIPEKISYLEKNGITDIQKIQGVDVTQTSPEEVDKYISPYLKYTMPDSVVGCAMAHMKTWETFSSINDNKYDFALVLEDDIILEKDFKKSLDKAIQSTPDDFDMLFLGTNLPNIVNFIGGITKINENINRVSLNPGMHAYVISKKTVANLLQIIKGNVPTHIDIFVSSLPNIKKYRVTNSITDQTSTKAKSDSSMIKTAHPIMMTNLAKNISIDGDSLYYMLNTCFFKIGIFNINFISCAFLILGIILAVFKVPLVYIITIFLLISVVDIYTTPMNKYVYFNLSLFLLPSIIVLCVSSKKKKSK